MMRNPTIFITIAFYMTVLTALFAHQNGALPISGVTWPQLHSRLQKRGLPGAVYICTERNFRGDCGWIAPSDQCHIPGTGDMSPKSIGPDPGGFCILYEKATCTGNQVTSLRFPGIDWAVPTFGGIKCLIDGPRSNSTGDGIVQNGGLAGSGILSADADGEGDDRLAGGIGSTNRKKLKDVLTAMEKDGFSEGMIGLEKGVYY